jgi:DNA-binding MarR family transcriptional regulator
MTNRIRHQLPVTPLPTVAKEMRRVFSPRTLQEVETLLALRAAAQSADNAVTEWLEDSAGSPARFQILLILSAVKDRAVPHKELVAALGVTRATVSGLMTALEREGLVTSSIGRDDRRTQLASLTPKGEAAIAKAHEANSPRSRAVFASFSPDELTVFMALLRRVREGFVAGVKAASAKPGEARAPRRG